MEKELAAKAAEEAAAEPPVVTVEATEPQPAWASFNGTGTPTSAL